MNFENISRKQLNELEQRVRELLIAMRKARLQQEYGPLMENLRALSEALGETRRERYDDAHPEYHAY